MPLTTGLLKQPGPPGLNFGIAEPGVDYALPGQGGAVLTADPVAPSDDTWWVRRTGVSPAMDVELRVRIAGVTYSLAGITI